MTRQRVNQWYCIILSDPDDDGHGMQSGASCGDFDQAGPIGKGFNPDGASAAAVIPLERVVADNYSGTVEVEADFATSEGTRRAKFVSGAKDEAGGVGTVGNQFGI